MIADLLPPAIATAHRFDDPPETDLFDAERALVVNAVDKRQREFATVRRCAREALAALGEPPAPLLPGERGAPQWPAGIVGSMTHCAGYRGAAVARTADVHTIGIDAEPHAPLPGGVQDAITLPEEVERLAALRAADETLYWDRLMFCCKESVYKAWFPLTRAWLGFDQASITIDPAARTFAARLLVPGPRVDGERLGGFSGRWLVRQGLALTAIAVLSQPDSDLTPPAAGEAGETLPLT